MKKFLVFLIYLIIFDSSGGEITTNQQPHIIFIYADDLGWNDLSLHGSPEIPTPNIDALAMNGILLNSYYGEYLCTPSRAALLTGKYPIRLGLQHSVLKPGEASGLPLNEITLAQRLKSLGYATHMVGKWHLGYMTKEYTPTYRGFDSFFGYYNGMLDYYDYTSQVITGIPEIPNYSGIDLWNGTNLVRDFRGQYATHVFTDEAKSLIWNHNPTQPLFLYLAHLAVHSGNYNNPLQAPPEAISKFKYIKDVKRRIQAAVISVLDESVGIIIETLHQKHMLENSIIVFASDNGAELVKEKGGHGSNYPLRGKKLTFWEGGVRIPALIWSPLLKLSEPKISNQLMHVSDWLPTLYTAAGGNLKDLGTLDGHSMWYAFLNSSLSPRTDLLNGLDPILGFSALRSGDWKLVNGTNGQNYDGWYGPTGKEGIDVPTSMSDWVFNKGSMVSDILKQSGHLIVKNMDDWYKKSHVTCNKNAEDYSVNCLPPGKPSLFNIKDDPCEMLNLAPFHSEIVKSMTEELLRYQISAAVPQSKPSDSKANPMCFDYAHVRWMDPENSNQYKQCDIL